MSFSRINLTRLLARMRALARAPAQKNMFPSVVTAVALALVALWLNVIGLPDSGILDRGTMSPEIGAAFDAVPPPPRALFASPGDSMRAPSQSTFELFENDVPLNAHSLHAVIREGTHNAFSHWGNLVLFSSSDGTDPRRNHRTYRFERRLLLHDSVTIPLLLCAAVVIWPWVLTVFWHAGPIVASGIRRRRIITVRQAVAAYVSLFFVLFLVIALRVGYTNAPRFLAALGANVPLPSRVEYYLHDPRPYTVIFLGDSRVYCAMHPEIIEKYVPEMHGLNLANFTNWFPTQHSMLRDIIAKIPEGTTVVWSIAHSNFTNEGLTAIQRVYPIALGDAGRLLWWGHGAAVGGLFDNLAYFHWPLYLPIALRDTHGRINAALNMPLVLGRLSQAAAASRPGTDRTSVDSPRESFEQKRAQSMRAEALRDPNAAEVIVTSDEGRPTSLVVFFRRGGYYRTEIDTKFFRHKQEETAKSISALDAATFQPPTFDPLRWRLFTTMLDLFAAHHVNLIVNEFEEAPHTYGSVEVREKWRQVMRERAQREVEKRGLVYSRVDFDAFKDDDYFDYNHLNSKGVAKYSPMIAAVIKRQLKK